MENFYDTKVTIIGTYTVFVNMSALVDDYNAMGIPMTFPTGQPELQFFSIINALYEDWDSTLQSWIPDT
ncbi:MAG: hypothetical protein KAX18_04170, partial [Candidatus Lokiarchaeota archaeon]|nr:hypothetical protein [Candidatus Lokiarchaeota archaeon]